MAVKKSVYIYDFNFTKFIFLKKLKAYFSNWFFFDQFKNFLKIFVEKLVFILKFSSDENHSIQVSLLRCFAIDIFNFLPNEEKSKNRFSHLA